MSLTLRRSKKCPCQIELKHPQHTHTVPQQLSPATSLICCPVSIFSQGQKKQETPTRLTFKHTQTVTTIESEYAQKEARRILTCLTDSRGSCARRRQGLSSTQAHISHSSTHFSHLQSSKMLPKHNRNRTNPLFSTF